MTNMRMILFMAGLIILSAIPAFAQSCPVPGAVTTVPIPMPFIGTAPQPSGGPIDCTPKPPPPPPPPPAPPPTLLIIGETSTNLGSIDNGNANELIAQAMTLPQSAIIQSLSIYITALSGNLQLGVYDASGPGGGPGQIKAQVVSFTPIPGWNKQNVTAPVLLPAGAYWLAFLPTSNGLGNPKNYGSGSCKWSYNVGGALPSPFPAIQGADACHWSFYATLSTL